MTRNKPEIKWVIIGDGRMKKESEQMLKELKLHNVFFLGRYPLKEMPHFFVHADATLVTLKKEDIFSMTIPSKVQSYMAFGKPILTMIDGIGNEVVEEAECGLVANAGDYEKLAKNAMLMSSFTESKLMELGEKSKGY